MRHRPDIDAVLHGNPRSEKWRGFNAGVRAAWRAWEGEPPPVPRPLVPRPGWTMDQEFAALSEEFFAVEEDRDRLAEQLAGAVAALERLANPTHRPRSEEAALLQAEVVQIAQATLDALGGQ